MSPDELLSLLLLATAMSFTPGPNTTLSTALAANHGLRHAMRFVVAVPVGWSAMLLLCSVGLGALLALAPTLQTALKFAGLAYMLWLAWKLAGSGRLAAGPDDRLDVGFGQGVALQFLNVKAWMLAMLISAGWVTVGDDLVARLAIVLPLMMAFAFTSNFGYALIGAGLRRWLAQGRRLLMFNRVLALMLAATAVWMARG